jgi:hypothetical protein
MPTAPASPPAATPAKPHGCGSGSSDHSGRVGDADPMRSTASAWLTILTLLACSRTTEFIGVVPEWNCGPRCFVAENLRALQVPAPELFTSAPDPIDANQPELRYPLAGSLHPLNLGAITFQWRSVNLNRKYYHLRITATAAPQRRYDFYIPCQLPPPGDPAVTPDQCTFPMPARAWRLLADENRDGEVTITVQAADESSFLVASGAPVNIAFTAAPLDAGLYYFSTGRTGILRAPIGGAAQPFILPGTAANRFACAGCHAVSGDGATIAFTAEQKTGFLTVARTADPQRPLLAPPEPPQANATTLALNHDGTLALVEGPGGQLAARETATGRQVAAVDAAGLGGGKLHFPEWSPDGREIAATLALHEEDPYTVNDGSIVVLPYDGQRFGALRTVVAADAGEFHFSPSWSPDGAWIVFASAPLPGRSYDNPQARLRLVSRAGGTPIELGRASAGGGATWPKFAPVTESGGQVLFFSFDSKRSYGYLLNNETAPRPQLWLASIDLRKRDAGDPSSAPVWLPFQDTNFTNVLGAWAPRLMCGPRSPCAEGARCEAGRCVARIP